jgi:hypothetical protein
MRTIALILAAVALSGCLTTHADTCRDLGAVPGTDGYLTCRMQLRARQESQQAQMRAPISPTTWTTHGPYNIRTTTR